MHIPHNPSRRYAEYEMQLEELRRVRRKTRNITGKRSLADFCIARRVHFIFERATRKFRGNLPLWMAWLKHCRNTKSHVQFSKVCFMCGVVVVVVVYIADIDHMRCNNPITPIPHTPIPHTTHTHTGGH